MTDLRKLARGKDCMLRIPLVCNHDRETTVLAHVRRGFYGMGTKPVDWCGVWACSACHDVYDERSKLPLGFANRDELESEMLRALCQQLAKYVEMGVLK